MIVEIDKCLIPRYFKIHNEAGVAQMRMFIETCREVYAQVPSGIPNLEHTKPYLCVECPKIVLSYLFQETRERVLLFGTARAFFNESLKLDLYDFNIERYEELIPRSIGMSAPG
jgi:hypothetical protein